LAVSAGAAVFQQAGPRGRELGTLAGAVVLLLLGTAAWGQAHAYHDLETLWRDTLAKNPQCWIADNNLGIALAKLGRTQEAKELRPDFTPAKNALARLGVGQ
jgi:Flp pilus assembly protein TadD